MRKKICETVGELELAEAEVIQQLILLIKREAISKIKQAAIHALGTALFLMKVRADYKLWPILSFFRYMSVLKSP